MTHAWVTHALHDGHMIYMWVEGREDLEYAVTFYSEITNAEKLLQKRTTIQVLTLECVYL